MSNYAVLGKLITVSINKITAREYYVLIPLVCGREVVSEETHFSLDNTFREKSWFHLQVNNTVSTLINIT